jgi:hypothetical protein
MTVETITEGIKRDDENQEVFGDTEPYVWPLLCL